MNLKAINRWWTKGMAKEQLRHSDSHKSKSFAIVMDHEQVLAPRKKGKTLKAR